MLYSNCARRVLACAAVALSLGLAGRAQAIVAFSIGDVNGVDPGFAPYETSVVTFDGANAAGVTETDSGPAGSVGLFTLTHIDIAAAPVGDTTMFEAIQPGGSAKFSFTNYAPGVGSLSVYIGSIDKYNYFEVSTSKANYFFDGTDFLNNNGDQFSHLTNRRVYFQFAPNEIFKSITFSSTGIAFEYDSLAAEPYPGAQPAWVPTGNDVEYLIPTSIEPVPEPGPWALMLTGFALLGVGARRRRRTLAI
jgi:hypothetical protein